MSRSKSRKMADLISGGTLDDGVVAASEVTGLHTVATSGSFNDLSDQPTLTTGPAGPAGPAGAASTVAGPAGPAGPAGATGATGAAGATGSSGSPWGGGTFSGNVDFNNYNISEVQNIHLDGAIYHYGDTNTYMQFHAADQWRVVTGGVERLEVNNSNVTSTEPIYAPSFHGNGSGLTGVGGSTSAGAVGTYMWARGPGSTTARPTFNFGSTYYGSTLYPAGFASQTSASTSGSWYYSSGVGIGVGPTSTAARSGTWRCMGQTPTPSFDENPVTLFVRIS